VNSILHNWLINVIGKLMRTLKARVAFAQLNLMELDKAPFGDMDVIFCQNVLIYFRRFRKRDVVSHLAARLQVGRHFSVGGW
jgi:type IV pilus assembly protein PilK